jgi:hypothetical protein
MRLAGATARGRAHLLATIDPKTGKVVATVAKLAIPSRVLFLNSMNKVSDLRVRRPPP